MEFSRGALSALGGVACGLLYVLFLLYWMDCNDKAIAAVREIRRILNKSKEALDEIDNSLEDIKRLRSKK